MSRKTAIIIANTPDEDLAVVPVKAGGLQAARQTIDNARKLAAA
jgi:hypothetical protein